jgi:aspartate aminotransferase
MRWCVLSYPSEHAGTSVFSALTVGHVTSGAYESPMLFLEPESCRDRLTRCRNVLQGKDEGGAIAHPSMFDRDVISFAHGEGVRRPHPRAVAAGVHSILDTVNSSLDNYLFLARLPELDEAIRSFFEQEGLTRDHTKHLCIDAGTTRVLYSCLATVCGHGDTVLVGPGYYHPLASWCYYLGLNLGSVSTCAAHGFKVTPAALADWYAWARRNEARSYRRPRVLLLFNPTMTGAIYSAEECQALSSFAEGSGLIVLEDAIFRGTEFNSESRGGWFANSASRSSPVVTIAGVSKAFGLANLRVGWASGPKAVIESMNDYCVATSPAIPQVAKQMTVAALGAPGEYIRDNAEECRLRAELVSQLVYELDGAVCNAGGRDPGTISVAHPPMAAHSLLVSMNGLAGNTVGGGRSVIRDSVDLARLLLQHAKVAVSPCFSTGFNDCTVRLSFGCIGADLTYEESSEREAKELMNSSPSLSAAIVDSARLKSDGHAFPSAEERVDLWEGDGAVRGFEKGRELITDAFQDRMIPSLVSLLGEG